MPEIGTGLNVLRSLVFVRNFGSQVLEKTNIRVRKESGSLARTALDTNLSPRRIRFTASRFLINVQKNRNPQDRLIDLFA